MNRTADISNNYCASHSESPSLTAPTQDGQAAAPQENFTLINPIHLGIYGNSTQSLSDDQGLGRIAAPAGAGVGAAALRSASTATARQVAAKSVARVVPIVGLFTAGVTTAEMVNRNQNQSDLDESIDQQVQRYLEGQDIDIERFVCDVILSDLGQRTDLASGVDYVGDYVAAGSSFLLMFPPAAAASFAVGTAIKCGSELGKQQHKNAIQNIYDLLAYQVVSRIKDGDTLNQLLPLLERRGLSADGMYRMEIWSFCRALERLIASTARSKGNDANEKGNQYQPLLADLERRLLVTIDSASVADNLPSQIRRELIPAISAGQLTLSQFKEGVNTLQRLQASTAQVDSVDLLQQYLFAQLKGQQLAHLDSDQVHDELIELAVNRAITASMADFDATAMLVTRIAFKLYIDRSGDGVFLHCSDQIDYRNYHFLIDGEKIELLRCGIYKVGVVSGRDSEDEASAVYIPYMRKVSITLSIEKLSVREGFNFLSGRCFKTLGDAEKQLPSQGIPQPFVDWNRLPEDKIEQQLDLLAGGLEKVALRGEFTRREAGQSGARKKSITDLLAATTQLIQANNRTVKLDNLDNLDNIDNLDPNRIESMLMTRQNVIRAVREWLADRDLTVEKAANGCWDAALNIELESALQNLEEQVLQLVNILLTQNQLYGS